MTPAPDPALRRVLTRVVALNLGYFGIEAAVALTIGSVALVADSVDFLEDASLNILILLALGWSTRGRARIGMGLAAILLVPTIATAWMLWTKIAAPAPPAALPLTLAGLGALAVNVSCAAMLARHRSAGGSLLRAAFLSSRNDALANVAIIAAGGVTALTRSGVPDIVVGLGIAVLNITAAREVFALARAEHRSALP